MDKFQIRIIDKDGNVIDTDDCIFNADELDAHLEFTNSVPVRIAWQDAYETDMADGTRGFICIVGVAA